MDRVEELRKDPRLNGPAEEPSRTLWNATCRIYSYTGVGSGFFIEPAGYIATCAHVVEGSPYENNVQWWLDGRNVRETLADVIAIDYSADLAILEITEQVFTELSPYLVDQVPELEDIGSVVKPPEEMEFTTLQVGDGLAPGDDYYGCGFPLGARTPRLTKGIISGYDRFHLEFGNKLFGPVLSGFINPGNSGGPIVNADGGVTGVVRAKRIPKPKDLDEQDLLGRYSQTGIGFALDPKIVEAMVERAQEDETKLSNRYEEIPPEKIEIPREAFVNLQVEARRHGYQPTGPFSYDSELCLYAGWSTDDDRPRLEVEGWKNVLEEMGRWGGSFFLRGYDVHLWRKKYSGFIIPVTLKLTGGR